MALEAPTTFLDLCQRTRLECGISGTGPSTVLGQTGESQRLVAWVAEAWNYIQGLHADWDFLRTSAAWTSVAGQEGYTLTDIGIAATFGQWKRDTFRNYVTADGTNSEAFMGHVDYDVWRDSYFFSGMRTVQSRPQICAIRPQDKAVMMGPPPQAGYTFTGDYFTVPVRMTADADVPTLPNKYIMVIVYKAMEYYALYEAAQEVLTAARRGFAPILRQMEGDRMPEIRFAGALA